MSEGDPTDHVLAAIASILDKPETSTSDESEAANPLESGTSDQPELLAEEILTAPPVTITPPPIPADVDTYVKFGPGPLAAIRFKWATRRDDSGDYFVDETIGDNSHPIVSGPMTKDAAIKFVDDHERQARQRFETLRSEMAGGEIGSSVDQAS